MAGCASRRGALALALLLAGCAPAAPTRPRLVLLYAPCTVARDFLAPYRPEIESTPNLAAFAKTGVVMHTHLTETAQSGVAYAALLTGTQADRHGIYFHPNRLAEENLTLAECFAAAGYETWFWSGQPMACAELGYGQGIPSEHTYAHEPGFRSKPQALSPALLHTLAANDKEFKALVQHLAADPSAHAFVQVCFTVSHEPYHQYAGPDEIAAYCERFPAEAHGVTRAEIDRWLPVYEEHRQRLNWDLPAARAELGLDDAQLLRLAAVIEAAYRTCLAKLDGYFGHVLAAVDAAGLTDQSLVCFTADHGEFLWRPNAIFPWTHGMELAPEELYVPWIVRAPGLAPRAIDAVTRSIDVFPTLLGLCGLPAPSTVEGVDLAPALRGEAPPPALLAFAHNSTLGAQRLERFADMQVLKRVMPTPDPERLWTAVRGPELFYRRLRLDPEPWRVQVFDHARDPGEEHDLFSATDSAQAAMAAELERYRARLSANYGKSHAGSVDEAEALERLRALGYVR